MPLSNAVRLKSLGIAALAGAVGFVSAAQAKVDSSVEKLIAEDGGEIVAAHIVPGAAPSKDRFAIVVKMPDGSLRICHVSGDLGADYSYGSECANIKNKS